MNCTARLARDCTNAPERVVYLDGVPKGQNLCASCIAFATEVGMNPVADRRAVQRIPEWRRRSLAKVMDHGAPALSGNRR